MNPLEYHEQLKGKIEIKSRAEIDSREKLSAAYTPGVAEVCQKIDSNPESVYKFTRKHNSVAIITDGSAVLGLGDIGAKASIPVMEGKSVLFKEFGDVDAFPLPIDETDPDKIIEQVAALSPMFGGINLEDISAPRCFYIEQELKEKLDIPVFHDDQHGTAIVVLAGLINAAKITNQKLENMKVAISGVGAAGAAIAELLLEYGIEDIILTDSQGTICSNRDDLNFKKKELMKKTNQQDICGNLKQAVKNRDVFIGVSAPGILQQDMVESMSKDPIIFALANPEPEIMPDQARSAGAKIVATGRSDFANQINNALVFPGLFRGLLDSQSSNITYDKKIKVAKALAESVKNPRKDKIIPDVLDKTVYSKVAEAVK
jgi:malate dehydrogenase (oxaloacetate-decarboxylating)